MKIFVDTAKIEEIKEAESWGILDGVTTNPSLIKKAVESAGEGVSLEEYIKDILRTVDGPVSLEVISTTMEGMITEAEVLYDKFNGINNNVVIKVPVNTSMEPGDDDFAGIKATKVLSEKGIPVNSTLIMTPNQALMAAKAGADYVSPFVGRIDDHIRNRIGLKGGVDYPKGTYYPEELAVRVWEKKLETAIHEQKIDDIVYRDHNIMRMFDWANDDGFFSGVDMLWSIKQIYDRYGFDTEIIAASIRTDRQVRQCAEMGVDIATIPFPVIENMMTHIKTSQGMKAFCDDVIPEYKAILWGKDFEKA